MVPPAPASSGPSSRPRSRRCSSSTPGSRSSTRGSTSSTATTSPTPSSPSRWARSSRGPRSCAAPSARAPATSARTATPGRSARPSTCCCASSRCAPAAPACSSAPARAAGRACSATSTSARRRASGGSTPDEHRQIAEDFCDFMAGNTAKFAKRLERQMKEAAAELDYEQAARLRDDIGALTKALEKRRGRPRRRDRRRRLRPRRRRARGRRPGLPRARRADPRPARLGRREGERGRHRARRAPAPAGLRRRRGQPRRGPARGARARRCPPTSTPLTEWLSAVRGQRVSVRVPQRGDKRTLMETVRRNAEQSLARHKVAPRRRPDRAQPGAAGAAGLPRPRRRAAAHRVLRRQPRPGHQRRRVDGRLRGRARAQERVPPLHRPGRLGRRRRRARTVDDTAAMHEVLTRRFRRYLEDAGERLGTGASELRDRRDRRTAPAGPTATTAPAPARSTRRPGRPRRFAYPPSLVVVDGGLPQVNAAQAVLDELGIEEVAARRPRQAPRGGVAARARTTR